MFNRFTFNASQFNQAVAAASSVDSGSTRSPFGHIMVAVPGGDLVLIYQEGTSGLAFRVSTNGGSVRGAETIISTRTGVYASAIINRSTLDIHVVYSAHGVPPSSGDEGIYYRPLIWDSVTETWDVGGEQTLAGGGSLYDTATAGRRNASISIGDDSFPVITYLRNEYGTVSWAMLVSQEANALTDFNVDLDIGVAADEDSRGALQQSTARTLYFVSRTGSSYNVASVIVANPVAATGINLTVFDSWYGSETEMVAVARNDDGDRLGIVYLGGDGAPRFRLYNLSTNALVSDTRMDTVAADSVTITWDGAVFWMAWVDNDNVQVSNSDAPATVVQTFANPGPDEDWSWLNSPVSCVDVAAVVFAWSATASSIYVGTFLSDRAIAEAETGAGAGASQIEVTQAETGAGVDVVAVVEAITETDTGAGVDTSTGGPLVADAGTGVDVIIKTMTEEETGEGADVATVGIVSADTGSGVDDAPIPTENIDTVDTGAGDGETAAVAILVTETGVGVITEAMGDTQAETGAGVDIAQILLGPEDDTGSGADAATSGPTVTDAGTGVDAVGSVEKRANPETGVGVDAAQIELSAAETGAGVDDVVTGNGIEIIAADTGVGVDAVSKAWIPTAVIVRLLLSSGEVRLKIES